MVEGAGFEPAKAEPSDLQSDPVDRLGTPPQCKRLSLAGIENAVKPNNANTHGFQTQSRAGRNFSYRLASALSGSGCQL
jgi:hypothetical protein